MHIFAKGRIINTLRLIRDTITLPSALNACSFKNLVSSALRCCSSSASCFSFCRRVLLVRLHSFTCSANNLASSAFFRCCSSSANCFASAMESDIRLFFACSANNLASSAFRCLLQVPLIAPLLLLNLLFVYSLSAQPLQSASSAFRCCSNSANCSAFAIESAIRLFSVCALIIWLLLLFAAVQIQLIAPLLLWNLLIRCLFSVCSANDLASSAFRCCSNSANCSASAVESAICLFFACSANNLASSCFSLLFKFS